MQQATSPTPARGHANREEYFLQNTELQRVMVMRNAERQAAFLLPHLRPGMYLLDCGCGPGSITTDLAQRVAPGRVIGVDIDASEIERATTRADGLGITNVQFRTGDVYELPFAGDTFDAIFSNALFDHLRDPMTALREMHRVLKTGGIAAIRVADRDGYLFSPMDALLEKAWKQSEEEKAAQGVSVRIGKHFRSYLRQVGFVRTEASASYDVYGTTESVQRIGYAAAATTLSEKTGSEEDAELDALAAAWKRWAESPDAFFAQALCEVVGWKE